MIVSLKYMWMVKHILFFPEGQGSNGNQPHWHSVFGLCSCSEISVFLKLRIQVVKHRRKVNGLIKLEKNMWIADKADQLDAAFESGDMHDMYKQVGAITKYAKNKTSSQNICRVSNSEGLPTQSYAEEKLAFRSHLSKTMSAKTLTYGEVIQKDRDEYNSIGCLDRFKHVSFNDL